MATTTQIRKAIRAAAHACGVSFKGDTTYTDTKPCGVYVCFPAMGKQREQAHKIAEEANFLLFAQTGETNVVRVVQTPRFSYNSGRTYIRATAN